MADELPLISSAKAQESSLLDTKAGWIGEDFEGKSPRLIIGGKRPLRRDRLYRMVEDGREMHLRTGKKGNFSLSMAQKD